MDDNDLKSRQIPSLQATDKEGKINSPDTDYGRHIVQ